MEVNLTKRIDTPEGRRYCPAIIAANGRVKPNWVLVNGKPEKHEYGIYYLEWRENGKRKRLSVGRDSDAAHQRQIRKLAELRALSQGLVVTDVEEEADKNHVKVAVHDFLEEVQLTKQDKTWRGYKIALKYFQESCDKTHLEDIQRIDLLRFSAFLRDKKKLAPRTVHNKFACVLTFLEAQGISKLVGKKDRPRFVDQEVEIYEEGELPALYRRCSPLMLSYRP
jgi:hypothetical protein